MDPNIKRGRQLGASLPETAVRYSGGLDPTPGTEPMPSELLDDAIVPTAPAC